MVKECEICVDREFSKIVDELRTKIIGAIAKR
jgi:hypothetical protein